MKTNTSSADKPKEFHDHGALFDGHIEPVFAMNPFIQFRTAILPFLIAFMLSGFGLSTKLLAVVPAPDGGYPGGNTAEGDNALFSLTTGASNTAIGFAALGSNTTRPVFKRSYPIQPVTTTRPTVITHSFTTQQAFSTRPSVVMRSITT